MRLSSAFFSNNINYAARRISSICRGSRSFHNFNFINIINSNNLVDINGSLRSGAGIGSYCTSGCIVHTSTINKNNNTSITINSNYRMGLSISIFTTPISSWCLNLNTRQIFQSIPHLLIMSLLNSCRINDIHITTSSVIRLTGNNIAKLVDSFISIRIHFYSIQFINLRCLSRINPRRNSGTP